MENVTDHGSDAAGGGDENGGVVAGTRSLHRWAKGVSDPSADSRVNIWSLNGFGEPVLTGGMYQPDEARILEETVKHYCAAKNVSLSQLCGGDDHRKHDRSVRGAWQEISQCLPHRTVLSVYRRALRQFHGLTRGPWSEEETASLFHLVELHGHKWKTIQDKLGRSATDCRVKFFNLDDQCQRGKWSADDVGLLMQKVRDALDVPKDGMDVREINQWTLERNSSIPWTAVSYRVKRRRVDCYFKWKQMTKRSNKKAIELGLEPMPMARETLKFDVRREYSQWKAEQDPKRRQEYVEKYVMPLLQKEGNAVDAQKEKDTQLLDFIIESRAARPSEVSWHTLAQRGGAAKDRWEELVDRAPDEDLDLPLWKLAKVVKDVVASADAPVKPEAATEDARNTRKQCNPLADHGNHEDEIKNKSKRKRKKNGSKP